MERWCNRVAELGDPDFLLDDILQCQCAGYLTGEMVFRWEGRNDNVDECVQILIAR
jgi:hypothetical protein